MEPTTKQFRKRRAIYECLCAAKTHPSAEMVHEMLKATDPDISLATVYRNLTYFKNQGLAVSVANVRGIERFDANTAPHVHFICRGCDAVIDLENVQVPTALCRQVEEGAHCRVSGCTLSFSGLCESCSTKGTSEPIVCG